MDTVGGGSGMNRANMVDAEKFFQKYEAMKEEYDSLRKRYTDLVDTHNATANKLQLTQEEAGRFRKLYDEARIETNARIQERNQLKIQCTAAIRQWDSALCERNEYKDALGKIQQQHQDAMNEVNQGMARSIKSNHDIKRLTEERDAALQEYTLIMSERDSVHRELEKLNDDLTQAKKQNKTLEAQNKELLEKVKEAGQETQVLNQVKDWAFNERDKIMREKESLRTLCESLRRERDRAVSDLAETLSESEEMKRQKNLATKQLKELRERIELEKQDDRSNNISLQYLSNSSSFSESRDSAIDSDLPSGHYSVKLSNVVGSDHGLVLEPGVYISRIVPGSTAAKESNLNIGDRILFINDTAIENVQDAIVALGEDVDPILLTLSRSASHLPSPLHHSSAFKKTSGAVPIQQSTQPTASNSSIKSDKSDPNLSNNGSRGGSSTLKSHGLRDIFRVRLPRKKLSSPEAEILETLDSAIAAGSGGGRNKPRRKRGSSSRPPSGHCDLLNSNCNKNGTWPRVMLNRHSACSYTLPHHHLENFPPGSDTLSSTSQRSSNTATSKEKSYDSPYHKRSDSTGAGGGFYPVGSSTLTGRGSGSGNAGKERIPLSSIPWDIPLRNSANSSNSATKSSNNLTHGDAQLSLHRHSPSEGDGTNSSSIGSQSKQRVGKDSTLTRSRPGFLDNEAGLMLTQQVLQNQSTVGASGKGTMERLHSFPPPPAQHRYSFGVFDPTVGSKLGKASDPQRNSVVPTLGMTGTAVNTVGDTSSIDLSVRSGNMEVLEYYAKRNLNKTILCNHGDHHGDHLEKVINSPSLSFSNPLRTTGSSSNVLSSGNGLSHYQNQTPLSMHHPRNSSTASGNGGSHHLHDSYPHTFLNLQISHSSSIPITPKAVGGGINTSFSFEPTFGSSLPAHHQHHLIHHSSGGSGGGAVAQHGSNVIPSSSMNQRSTSSKLLYQNSDDLLGLYPSSPIEISGTFPRKREPQRIRIPSNQSVTSRSSTEKYDYRNSPMPTYHIEVLDPGTSSDLYGGGGGSWHGRSGELRSIRIEKSSQPLGIQIKAKGGGIFISCVTEGSVASQANLRVGSQILEICGINMRSASYEHAAQVLQQCKDTVTMLVQYLPEKYYSLPDEGGGSFDSEDDDEEDFNSEDGSSSSSEDENQENVVEQQSRSHRHRRSGGRRHNSSLSESAGSSGDSPTPCNSPQSTLVRKKGNQHKGRKGGTGKVVVGSGGTQQMQQSQVQTPLNVSLNSHGGSVATGSGRSGVTLDKLENSKSFEKPRFLTLQMSKNTSSNLGICLVGGNVVGIFVHSVQKDSIADRAGLKTGDRILEYNGHDLREATAEEAAFELAKPLDKVKILVQSNIQRYNEIKDQPGDGFYIRALFEFPALSNDAHHQHHHGIGSNSDSQMLSFFKDEILYVDNTMYNGKPGKWRAWKVDTQGQKKLWGLIPSKFKIEEDLMFKRNLGELGDDSRRSSTIVRRSFFRKKSSSQNTSRELASFSDFSINNYGRSAGNSSSDGLSHGNSEGIPGTLPIKDDPILNSSYQRVERLDYMLFLRPVVILGALSDLIVDRLIQDFPYEFGRAQPEIFHCSSSMLEKGLTENMFIDYKRKGSHYECITIDGIKEIASKKLHCITELSTGGIERLQRAQLYPIVLLIKFKNHKQIREIKDLRGCDKITQKVSKELFEHSLKIENEYKNLITSYVVGGTNVSYVTTQLKTAVEREQSKTLWVPV